MDLFFAYVGVGAFLLLARLLRMAFQDKLEELKDKKYTGFVWGLMIIIFITIWPYFLLYWIYKWMKGE